MHILVTGATGFIGQNLVTQLLARGDRVTILSRPGAAAKSNTHRLEYLLGSCDPLVIPNEIEAIVHLAQSRAHRSFPEDAAEMFRVNVLGAQTLLLAAAAAPVAHFCLVSSGSVYEPFEGSLVETAALSPRSYLGASKLAGEIIAAPFRSLFGLSVLRLFAPYGPGQRERLVPDLIRRIRDGQAIELPKRGGGLRFSPTYVDDISSAIVTCLEERWDGTFNVASPISLTIAKASETIGKMLGKPVVFDRTSGSKDVIVPALDRLAQRYDLNRFRTFESGLAETLADLTR